MRTRAKSPSNIICNVYVKRGGIKLFVLYLCLSTRALRAYSYGRRRHTRVFWSVRGSAQRQFDIFNGRINSSFGRDPFCSLVCDDPFDDMIMKCLKMTSLWGITFSLSDYWCTEVPAYSATLGTWEKCHCNQIVTVTRLS